MKSILNTCLVLSVLLLFSAVIFSKSNVCPTGGPELYTNIKDYQNSSYKIIAIKSDNSPIYGVNYEYTEEFDAAEDVFEVDANLTTACEGFDWIEDPGALDDDSNDDLGYGYYYIKVIRNYSTEPETIIAFYLDLRMAKERLTHSPDIHIRITITDEYRTVEYSYYDENYILHYGPLLMNSTIKIWENHGNLEKDFTPFFRNIEITNDLSGTSFSSEKIVLTQAEFGFPNQQYSIGDQVTPGEHIDFWHGVEYGFSVSSNIVFNNGADYLARHWNTSNNIGFSKSILIDKSPSFTRIVVYYLPTQPLTVTNYLEGGTSTDDFKLTWQNALITNNYDYGTHYDAFTYQDPINDRYTIEALPITAQRYGTNWTFLNWNTGSTSTTLQNIKVPDDIPLGGSFIANYKGHFTSAQSDAFTSNGQRKIVLDSQGKYHLVYPSYGKIWSTQSNNTDFNGVWSNEIIFAEESDLQLKNPSIDDFDGYTSATVYEGGMNGLAGIFLAEKYLLNNDIPVISQIPETGIDPNYFGNIKPVVAYTAHEIFVVYKPSSSSPLRYWRKYYNGGQWLTEGPLNLPTSNQYSLNPSIVGDNSDNLHIVWQQSNSSIRYLHSYVSGVPYGNRYFEPNSYNVSTGAGYSTNEYPSVSLTDFNQAIISWKAGRHENPSKLAAGEETDLIWVSRVLVRPFWITSGGDFYAAGLNVNYSNNNSTTENGVTNSVIAYSQNNGESCRWIKRTAFGYTAAGSFNENGIQVQLSSGGNFSQIKAVVFENATAPFHLQKSNTNFLSKITSLEPGYSRTGVVRKEEAEFVFSFGDLRLDGENILFIEKPDTLPIPGVSEFNQYFRTENFYIDHTSQLLLSAYYFVLNPEVAQTVLSDNDEIVYKIELVNANSGEVVGLFDEVTFDKNTLFDHDNTNYSVDCSEVTADEYYFRLVTEVMGEYYYHLSNEQNDSETLGKKIYDNISYLVKLESLTYALAQNYPNPFNPSTTIKYQIPNAGNVTLKVFDILGREVTTLVDEFKNEGRYEVTFNASKLASGVYIYKIQSGDFVNSKKMILIK